MDNSPVISALGEYVAAFPSKEAAARKIGVDSAQLRKWLRGGEIIPEWMAKELGYEKRVIREWVKLS